MYESPLPNGNYVTLVKDINELVTYWPLLLSGMVVLNDPHTARGDIDPSKFFNLLLDVVTGPKEGGAVAILRSKNGKELGYGVIIDSSDITSFKRVAYGYVLYSNGKCSSAGKDLVTFAEMWAKAHGYDEMQCMSRRINGAAMRLFEKKFGFHRNYIVFKKDL